MYFSLPSIVLSGFVTIRPSRTLCLFRTGYLYFARQISITAGVCQVPADICSVVSPKAIPITNLFMVDSRAALVVVCVHSLSFWLLLGSTWAVF